MEFARNAVKNYDGRIGDNDFFDIFINIKEGCELAAELEACLPQDVAEKYRHKHNPRTDDSPPSFADIVKEHDEVGIKYMLAHFHDTYSTRECVRKMLSEVAASFLDATSNAPVCHEQERFETVARLLRLGRRTSDLGRRTPDAGQH